MVNVKMKARFLPDQKWRLEINRYAADGSCSMQLFDPLTGEPWMRLTVCLAPSFTPPYNHAYIKDWSENEGALDGLLSTGLVRKTGRQLPAGYAIAHEVELLGDLKAYNEEFPNE